MVLKKNFQNSADGWYKLLSKEEGDSFNLPIEYSKEKDEQIQQKLDEIKDGINILSSQVS